MEKGSEAANPLEAAKKRPRPKTLKEIRLEMTIGPQISANFRKLKTINFKNTLTHWAKNEILVFSFKSATISANLRLNAVLRIELEFNIVAKSPNFVLA
jgi:hypothetical protein